MPGEQLGLEGLELPAVSDPPAVSRPPVASPAPGASQALAVLDAAVGVAVDHRVRLHRERAAGTLDVPGYLAGLEAVRQVEDALEPIRRELGAAQSRAFELAADAGGEIVADPRTVPCPTCGAKVGSPCKRPSGHAVFGGDVHAGRRKNAHRQPTTGT